MTTLPPLFDTTKYFGVGSNERPDFPTAGSVLAHLDRLGIARALCWHVISRDQHPMRGNRMLLAEIAATPGAAGRLLPAFTIGPAMQYEPGAIGELKQTMMEHGARAVRVFRSRWSLLQIEPVVRALLGLQPVVFVDAREGMNARDFLDFAEAFPSVPLVILHTMWGDHLTLFDLMQRCRNIYADTSWMHTEGTIALIARTFGAQRLLFGAGWKAHNGAAIIALAHADITHEAREAIAGGNLARLLNLPEAAPTSPSPEEHRLWQSVTDGQPLRFDVVDAHGHLGELGMWILDSNDIDAQATRYLRSMDRLGVRMAILSGEEALFGDPVEGNAYLRDRTRPYGDRFRGYLGFHPLFADVLLPRLDEFFADPFFVGFKVLCDYWGIPVTDPRFTPVWEYANAHRLPILLHTWNGPYDDPAMLKEIAPAYPDASFLLGHSGGGDRTSAEELALANPNVYLEWCGSFCTRQSWEDTLQRIGNRQVVYGTDGIFHDPSWELGRLLTLNVPDSTLHPIFGDNMRAILARRR